MSDLHHSNETSRERDEKFTRRLIAIALLAISSAIAARFWLLAPEASAAKSTRTKVIRARRYELLDQKGRVRAVVGMSQDRLRPRVTLFDAKGKKECEMSGSSLDREGNMDLGGFVVWGNDGKVIAALGWRPGQSGSLFLGNARKGSISMGTDHGPALLMSNREKSAVMIENSAALGPSISLADQSGHFRLVIDIDGTGGAGLSLSDRKEIFRFDIREKEFMGLLHLLTSPAGR